MQPATKYFFSLLLVSNLYNCNMLKNDKLLQIYNSFKYKSIHPYKYFIFKNRYKKIRTKSIEILKSDNLVINLSKETNFKIFNQYKDEYK